MKYTIPKEIEQFFNWKTYEKHNLVVPGGITIFVGGRNIGKTTGTFIDWIKQASNEEQIFYIRNTEKELKQYAKTFNTQFANQFYMTTTEIYKLEKVDLYKKVRVPGTNNYEEVYDKTEYRRGEVIGFCGALSGGDGWRSANFQNIKYIFSDEFNQIGNSLSFEKFMTLWTSIIRTKQNVYTILVGNRDDASSDIIVELGIDILVPEKHKGDWVVPLLPNSEKYHDKCYFVDIDDNRFQNNQEDTVWKELGKSSITLANYYDRGYKSYDNIDCKRLKKETMDRVQWLFTYAENEKQTLIVGKLEDIVIVHYLRPEEDYKAPKNYSDSLNTYTNKKYDNLFNDSDYFFYTIINGAREHNIIYTSIYVKADTNKILAKLAILKDIKNFKL